MEKQVTYRSMADDNSESAFRMIDVGAKMVTQRIAVARGRIQMSPDSFARVVARSLPKGDVLALAEVAGILAAKKTAEILPLCHPLSLDAVKLVCDPDFQSHSVIVTCEARTSAKTGVEMEALLGVNAALLCIYDLVKAIDPVLVISDVFLCKKSGGKSGEWVSPLLASSQIDRAVLGSDVLRGIRFAVVTVSDRCWRGEADDVSGPLACQFLKENGSSDVESFLLPDELDQIRTEIERQCKSAKFDVIIISGGTGVSPRDVTPEALSPLWTKHLSGFGELLRHSGASHNYKAWLSRSSAGLIGRTLVVMLPGSPKAVVEGLSVLKDLIPHSVEISKGGRH